MIAQGLSASFFNSIQNRLPAPSLDSTPTAPAHPFDSAANDRQANPHPGILFLGMQSFENLKDPLLIFRRDADAVVFNPDANKRRIGGGLTANVHRRPRGGCDEFHRIR